MSQIAAEDWLTPLEDAAVTMPGDGPQHRRCVACGFVVWPGVTEDQIASLDISQSVDQQIRGRAEVNRAALLDLIAEPTLDAAWRAAAAALPEGWQFELGRLDFDGPWYAFAKSRAFWEDDYRVTDREQQIAEGEGPTPVAALLALATRLKQ